MIKREKKKRVKPNVCKELYAAFKNGSFATRLSFLFVGFGQLARGQMAKGFLYLLTQAAFLLFMIFFGGRYIAHCREAVPFS